MNYSNKIYDLIYSRVEDKLWNNCIKKLISLTDTTDENYNIYKKIYLKVYEVVNFHDKSNYYKVDKR